MNQFKVKKNVNSLKENLDELSSLKKDLDLDKLMLDLILSKTLGSEKFTPNNSQYNNQYDSKNKSHQNNQNSDYDKKYNYPINDLKKKTLSFIEIGDIQKYEKLYEDSSDNFFIIDLLLKNNHKIEIITNSLTNKLHTVRIDDQRSIFENFKITKADSTKDKLILTLEKEDPAKKIIVNNEALGDIEYRFIFDTKHIDIHEQPNIIHALDTAWGILHENGINAFYKNNSIFKNFDFLNNFK